MSNSKLNYRAKTTSNIPKIMVFRPTLEEMRDFSSYIEFMESKGAHKAGLAKIIPPSEWKPRKAGYEDIINSKQFKIKNPIKQEMKGKNGIFQAYNIEKKTVSVYDFKKMAENRNSTPNYYDYDDLERKYWANIHYTPPYYGADMQGSLYDEDCEEFNIQKLGTCLDLINNEYGISIEGVNTPYLYFGMWKATFAWHTEDCDLYSINYLHYGLPKSWYAIPPEYGFKFEDFCRNIKEPNFHGCFDICPAFLRHKTSVIQPSVLKENSIPFNKITQEAGEFMITFPFSYHCGYNHGYNCAESTNFALPRWVEYGKRASQCVCRNESVHINMECFIKKYQPERYDLWKEGKDIGCHPEDPLRRMKAAPSPFCQPEVEVETKPISKRQAAAKSKRSKKNKKRKASDCELFNTACLDESDCPYSPNEKQPKKKKKKKCEDPKPSSSVQSDLDIDNLSILDDLPIKHPKIVIKRDHQLMGFVQSSALDKLSEETKINITVPINHVNNNNNESKWLNDNSVSSSTSSESSTNSNHNCNQGTLPTKAALKQYDDDISQSINTFKDDNQTPNCDMPRERSVSPRPEDPRLASKRYLLFNSNLQQRSPNSDTQSSHQTTSTLSSEPFKTVIMNTSADDQPSNTSFVNKIILNSSSTTKMPQSFDVRATQASNIRTEIKINNSGDSDALK